MTPEELETLLQQDESEYLEFKERIDFATKETKAHFLKEVLALANIPRSPAYLIVGVEDKTKKPIGVKGLTEEQLHQVVAEHCKPPIPFSYKAVEHKGIVVGVLQIFRSNLKPHTLKTRFTYQDTHGRPQELRETQVFTRHGSIVAEATREELLVLAQDRDSNTELLSRIVGELEKLGVEFPEANDNLREIYNQIYKSRPREHPDRVLGGAFISIVAGCISAWVFGSGWPIGPPLILALWFATSLVFSALRIVKYSLVRALINSLILELVLKVKNKSEPSVWS